MISQMTVLFLRKLGHLKTNSSKRLLSKITGELAKLQTPTWSIYLLFTCHVKMEATKLLFIFMATLKTSG